MKRWIALSALAALMVGAHAADPYPSKPITIVVPFAAGGPTDRVARDLAESLRKPLGGATIIIDNSAGAGSSIGSNKVAKAAPDGYTLLLNHIGMATMPSLLRNIPFKVESDFEYLGLINDVPMTLIGKPALAANNYKELATWINANKGKINLGNAGIGSASHLCGLLFQNALQVDMTTVPYKGTAPAMSDLIGGQIDLMCDQTTNTTSQIEGKKVKAFAVTTPRRLSTPALKDLPTLDESGLKGFQVTIFHGLYAPKGTPADIQKKLNDALKDRLQLEKALDEEHQKDIDAARQRGEALAELSNHWEDGARALEQELELIGLTNLERDRAILKEKARRETWIATLLALAVLATPVLHAQESISNTGIYMGISAGESKAHIDNARITQGLLGAGLATDSLSEDRRDTGYKAFIGFPIHPNWAVEAGYFDLGRFGFSANTTPAGSLTGSARDQVNANGELLKPSARGPLAGLREKLGG